MSGAEDDKVAKWYEKGKYKLLFDDVKEGPQFCIPGVEAESMAHTLIILVWSLWFMIVK
jgi:hypothetical protein